ncbi:hypothetical protein [Bacteroides sp. CAG:633]|uniref:hypothetical protein n=1 Tax=Bacteroides sp. CAG:633 TaxID=1262744 RepID=UPI00258C0400|nr:hypothetical protein [Bacteroides sp. CAG:633]
MYTYFGSATKIQKTNLSAYDSGIFLSPAKNKMTTGHKKTASFAASGQEIMIHSENPTEGF